jgi:hypothetical protein
MYVKKFWISSAATKIAVSASLLPNTQNEYWTVTNSAETAHCELILQIESYWLVLILQA